MNPRIRHSLAALAVTVAIAAAIWIGRDVARNPEPKMATQTQLQIRTDLSQQPDTSIAAPAPVASAVEMPEPQAPSNDDPRVREFEQRAQFQQEVRSFFAQVPMLSSDERTARASSIAQQITQYEAAGEIAAAEALTLRSGLIRETVPDPAEQVEAVAALQKHYFQQGKRKQAEWEARIDPEFELYKAREREIIAEVSALTRVPDGLSRDEYLRRRLQNARE
jgi:hypothetical protein